MTKAVIVHNVVDVERWLEGKEERAAIIGRFATDIQDYVAEDGSNQIAVTCDFHDLEGMAALIASPPPEDAEIMEKHGVRPPVTLYLKR